MKFHLYFIIFFVILFLISSLTFNSSKINEYFSSRQAINSCTNCILSNRVVNLTNCTNVKTLNQAKNAIISGCDVCKNVYNSISVNEANQLGTKLTDACKFMIMWKRQAEKAEEQREQYEICKACIPIVASTDNCNNIGLDVDKAKKIIKTDCNYANCVDVFNSISSAEGNRLVQNHFFKNCKWQY